MRVRVDARLCQGHNRCVALAPALFDLDGYGYASAVSDEPVPPELEDAARLAEANCPERAVVLDP
jgi:ferredoxin